MYVFSYSVSYSGIENKMLKANMGVFAAICFISLLPFSTLLPQKVAETSKSNLEKYSRANIVNKTQNARIGSYIYIKELGYFNVTKDFYHPIWRPINLLPNDRVTINTKFYLYTKDNPKEFYNLAYDSLEKIKNAPINNKVSTKFIVHGFIDNKLYGKWMKDLKDNLLLSGDFNVVIVDWSGGNAPPYTQAAANTRVVGAEIALMIQKLQKYKGVSPMDCHIIGHSLGAHVAGYAGKRLQTLGRISGADPAEPFFQNMPATVRLDRTDADFVDVIHTDSKSILLLGLGMAQAVGHVDFYPNGGKTQPGCSTHVFRALLLDGLVEAARRFIACNHQRAVDFYIFSINYRKALPVGYECTSWDDFNKGLCADCGINGSKCAIMGMKADHYKPLKNDEKSRKFYLATADMAPYWTFNYHITVKLFKPKTKFADQRGTISLVLHGSRNSLKTVITDRAIDLYHGSPYKFLIKTRTDVGTINSITFRWKNTSWNFLREKIIHLESVIVVSMNDISNSTATPSAQKFCNNLNNAVKTDTDIPLKICLQ